MLCFEHGNVIIIVQEKCQCFNGGTVVYTVDYTGREGRVDSRTGYAVAEFIRDIIADVDQDLNVYLLFCDSFSGGIEPRAFFR